MFKRTERGNPARRTRRGLFGWNGRGKRREKAGRSVPLVASFDELEPRLLMSTLTWTGTLGPAWSAQEPGVPGAPIVPGVPGVTPTVDPSKPITNWLASNGSFQVPANGDTLIFPGGPTVTSTV